MFNESCFRSAHLKLPLLIEFCRYLSLLDLLILNFCSLRTVGCHGRGADYVAWTHEVRIVGVVGSDLVDGIRPK